MKTSRLLFACSFAALAALSLTARAQGPSEGSAPRHFDAAVRAFDDRRFADAAAEFERAYALEPRWQLLYNLGSVYCALGRPVEAVDRLERYLREGGAGVSPERRGEVALELERQRAKLARLDVRVNEGGAEVRVDAIRVGWSPLSQPVTVAAGQHVIDVSLGGRQPERREVEVIGRQALLVQVTLAPVPSGAAASDGGPAPDEAPHFSAGQGQLQRTTGYWMGGLGVVAAGAGAGITYGGGGRRLGMTVAVGGFAALLGGVVLVLAAPSDDPAESAWRIDPWLSVSAGGLSMKGAF